ncbi:C10 family peptidase [Candidatus Fermentibacteria bacterium]|nr:C10 family peptidase [Candidatus Fermentibacteria bacterium]
MSRLQLPWTAVLLAVIFIVSTEAAPVAVETARQVAENWYAERGHFDDGSVRVTGEVVFIRDGAELFRAINMEPVGFVLVASDDAVIPILGYGFDHHFSDLDHPPQFDAMLASFEEQILFAKAQSLWSDESTRREWQRLKVPPAEFDRIEETRAMAPLMVSLWNQGWSWNQFCPADANGPGGHVYAGCGAVSMAQVMRYWNHPAQGLGQHSYYAGSYGNQSANFGATTYDWASMSNTSATNAARTLLYHCGVAVDMQYGPNGSGCYASDLVPAMENYFRFNTQATFKWKSSYSSSAWESMIRAELDAGRPMMYVGSGTGGHAFNLDGYQGTNYFHFNWGWSGSYNGYYYLNDLTPGSYNFTDGQGGSFNLFPNNSLDSTPPGAITNLAAAKDGVDVVLTWASATDNVGVVGYWVYGSTSSYGPLTPLRWIVAGGALTYTASGACGDPNTVNVFAVRAMDAAQNQSAPSNRAGEFDYSLP